MSLIAGFFKGQNGIVAASVANYESDIRFRMFKDKQYENVVTGCNDVAEIEEMIDNPNTNQAGSANGLFAERDTRDENMFHVFLRSKIYITMSYSDINGFIRKIKRTMDF